MTLASGTRLGPYEILAPIGAGGMGEVYKARDTRLGRDVALKVLAADVADSPEASARFDREARTISQLSHPHICPLFDVGAEGAVRFLVMPLLDGETLASRLAKAPLPSEVTTRFAAEMADALDAAHRAGVIHRDLKPANVMLTKSGVKLLDFGLAKPTSAGAANALTASPVSAEGAVAGTVQYMAPEQLEGRSVDHRSDIWALGAVVYEMATGERLFRATRRAIVPAALDRIVCTCLAEDPEDRWQSARDVVLQLRALENASAGDSTVIRPRRSAWIPWVVSAAAALGLVASVVRMKLTRTPPLALPAVRFLLPPPAGSTYYDNFENDTVALAPDGSQVGFIALDANRTPRLYLRGMSALESRPLAGSEGTTGFFWSPDSRSIALTAGGKLKRIDLPSGAPVTLCDVPDGTGVSGTWGDGSILYATVGGEAIYRVSQNGGAPVAEIKPERADGVLRTGFPWFLPDGRRFLYLARLAEGGRIMLADPGKPPKFVLAAVSNVQYVEPGYIIYSREGSLVAQGFDADRGEVSGAPQSVADAVRYFYSTAVSRFATARGGALVFHTGADSERLAWIDREGRETATFGPSGTYISLRISPDGEQVLFSRTQRGFGTFDLWQADFARGLEQRLTSDPTSEINAVWHPSGQSVYFAADRGGPPHVFRKDLTTGAETQSLPPSGLQEPNDVTRDGSVLLFTERAAGNTDVWTLPVGGGARAPLVQTRFRDSGARLSPDNRLFAFESNESGRTQIYVSPYPPTGVKMSVSGDSGGSPRWSRDGRELFFLTFDRRLVAVPVAPTGLSVGAPRTLFALPGRRLWKDYDVSLDGKRFLAIVTDVLSEEQPLTVVTNWRPDVLR